MGMIVRLDAINHIVPKKEGKKEWYVIYLSAEYRETTDFVGWERVDPVFMTPEEYEPFSDEVFFQPGALLEAIVEPSLLYGKIVNKVTGFREITS